MLCRVLLVTQVIQVSLDLRDIKDHLVYLEKRVILVQMDSLDSKGHKENVEHLEKE